MALVPTCRTVLLSTVALLPTCCTVLYCRCLPAYRGIDTYLLYSSVLHVRFLPYSSVLKVGYVLRGSILAAYRGFDTYLSYSSELSSCLPRLRYLPVVQQGTVRTLHVVE